MSSNNSIDSDIQRLTLEINERKESAETWDKWNIRFIFLAGFIAVCLGVTAIGVSRSNGALVRSSEELSNAKDSKLALDLRTKDGEIAHAQQLAGDANRRAQELARENIEIKGTINRSVADTLLREEELKAKNLATEAKLESERNTRFELEKSLAPRILPITLGPEPGKSSFDSLKPFAGVEVTMEVLPDAEAMRAAGEIRQVLEFAGWKISGVSYRADINFGYFDGVTIQCRNIGGRIMMLGRDEIKLEDRRGKAGDALEKYLYSNGWEARASLVPPDQPVIAPNAMKIIVGFKPSPFFVSPETKELKEKVHKIKEEMEQREKERQKEWEKWERAFPPPKPTD